MINQFHDIFSRIFSKFLVSFCNLDPQQGDSLQKGFGCFLAFLIQGLSAAQHFSRDQNIHCTEVRRAPLIHFQKIFFKKGFFRSKLARKLKFYARIIIEDSKSLKKSQKTLTKATNLV